MRFDAQIAKLSRQAFSEVFIGIILQSKDQNPSSELTVRKVTQFMV